MTGRQGDLFSGLDAPADLSEPDFDDPFARASRHMATQALRAKQRTAERRAMKVKVVKSEADAPMKLSAMEQDQQDKSVQMRLYRRERRAQVAAMRDSIHGEAFQDLQRLLRRMTIEEADQLVAYVKSSGWLKQADLKTRQLVLSEIDDAIVRLRLINGYPPFDDSLPGEPPKAFEIIRDELRVCS